MQEGGGHREAMARSSVDVGELAAFLRFLGHPPAGADEMLLKALEDHFPEETVRNVREKLPDCLTKVYDRMVTPSTEYAGT